MIYTIEEIKNIAIPIVSEYGIAKLSIFGSYACGEANDDSDLDVNEETISPEAGTVCELVEKNQKDIAQILETIGSTQATTENPNGTGIQGKINILETDTATLKNTHFHKGRQIELINAKQTSTKAFTAGETIACSLNAIPGLNISSKINDDAPYSYDLEISLLVKLLVANKSLV